MQKQSKKLSIAIDKKNSGNTCRQYFSKATDNHVKSPSSPANHPMAFPQFLTRLFCGTNGEYKTCYLCSAGYPNSRTTAYTVYSRQLCTFSHHLPAKFEAKKERRKVDERQRKKSRTINNNVNGTSSRLGVSRLPPSRRPSPPHSFPTGFPLLLLSPLPSKSSQVDADPPNSHTTESQSSNWSRILGHQTSHTGTLSQVHTHLTTSNTTGIVLVYVQYIRTVEYSDV
ncbi:hypothetical protein V9T40_012969 [Parthenolecanium corni]|uniref:Uncharacterized protein n=1 Tax=Parthenolecanium corni TaxID=536013 RepID=A0AAN9TC29_9HEMI